MSQERDDGGRFVPVNPRAAFNDELRRRAGFGPESTPEDSETSGHAPEAQHGGFDGGGVSFAEENSRREGLAGHEPTFTEQIKNAIAAARGEG